jgi:hypothetical protein
VTRTKRLKQDFKGEWIRDLLANLDAIDLRHEAVISGAVMIHVGPDVPLVEIEDIEGLLLRGETADVCRVERLASGYQNANLLITLQEVGKIRHELVKLFEPDLVESVENHDPDHWNSIDGLACDDRSRSVVREKTGETSRI